jgi:hypothetical protein
LCLCLPALVPLFGSPWVFCCLPLCIFLAALVPFLGCSCSFSWQL